MAHSICRLACGLLSFLNMTIRELCKSVLNRYAVEEKRCHLTAEYRIRLHLEPLLGDRDAATLESSDLDDYVAQRKAQGAENGTIGLELAILRRGWTLHRRTLGESPLFPRLKATPPREGLWSPQEFARLLQAVAQPARAPLHFAYLTGWRLKSEVLPLRWDCVDDTGVNLRWGKTKNGDSRRFPFMGQIGGELVKLLTAQRALQRADSPFVFHRNGRPIKSIRMTFENSCRRLGYAGKIMHDLRRTAMTNLVGEGELSMDMAMCLTGHRDRKVADRYHIKINRNLRRAMEAMNPIELPKF